MSRVGTSVRALACFCFRQVVSRTADAVVAGSGEVASKAAGAAWTKLEQYWTDHAEDLPKALVGANDKTWDAIRYALSDGKWDAFKNVFKTGDHKGVTGKLRRFIDGQEDVFRRQCLVELEEARKSGILQLREATLASVLRETSGFSRYKPDELHQAAQQFVAVHVAIELKKARYPNLAELTQLSPDGRMPLLVLTFTAFFRAELSENDTLRNNLEFDMLENLSAGQNSILQLLDQQYQILKRVERKIDAGFKGVGEKVAEVKASVDDVKAHIDAAVAKILAERSKRGPGSAPSAAESDSVRDFRELCKKYPHLRDPDVLLQMADRLDRVGLSDLAHETRVGAVNSLPPPPLRFKAGDTLAGRPGWTLERHLGDGGFGEVWLAQGPFDEFGAVKFCKSLENRDLSHEGRIIARVKKESRNFAGVVPLRDAYLDGEVPWLMYEYIEGGDLVRAINHWAKLPSSQRQEKVLHALQRLASSVARFHALNPPIVHRDLKPANILYDQHARELRITDFGIGGIAASEFIEAEKHGTLTKAAQLHSFLRGSYTPIYASPQQKAGSPPDPRDDVHALGVIGYQMLTGQLTHGPGSDFVDDLRDLAVSDELIELLRRCTAQKLERRIKDAGEIAEALDLIKKIKKTNPSDQTASTRNVESTSPPLPTAPIFVTTLAPEEEKGRRKMMEEQHERQRRQEGWEERESRRRNFEQQLRQELGGEVERRNEVEQECVEEDKFVLIRCAHCGATGNGSSRILGTLVKCSECKQSFVATEHDTKQIGVDADKFVRIRCAHCGATGNGPTHILGAEVRCSKCKQAFVALKYDAEEKGVNAGKFVLIRCAHCGATGHGPPHILGTEVKCSKCNQAFVATKMMRTKIGDE